MKNDRQPTHYLYAVTKRTENSKGVWTRIGAAWPNSDGEGYSFRFDLFPSQATDIAMRARRPKDTTTA